VGHVTVIYSSSSNAAIKDTSQIPDRIVKCVRKRWAFGGIFSRLGSLSPILNEHHEFHEAVLTMWPCFGARVSNRRTVRPHIYGLDERFVWRRVTQTQIRCMRRDYIDVSQDSW
jgi:hypothetical protein